MKVKKNSVKTSLGQLDVVLCKTNENMKGVIPVKMMPAESLKKIGFKCQKTGENVAPNLTPFPAAMFVGMGTTGSSQNRLGEQYVGWLNITGTSLQDMHSAYDFKSYHFDNGKDYLASPGDSGSGVLAQDPTDKVFKLISVASKRSSVEGISGVMSGDVLIEREIKGDNDRYNSKNITKWLEENGLDGTVEFDDYYNPLQDPFLPEPPLRVPDNESISNSRSTTQGNYNKAALPKDSMLAGSTLTVTNKLPESEGKVFIQIGGDLFGNAIRFEQELEANAIVKREMPAGFKASVINLSYGGQCHSREWPTPWTNQTKDYGLTLKGNGSSLRIFGSGVSPHKKTDVTCNYTMEYTSPFRLHPPHVEGKFAWWLKTGGYIGAGVAGAAALGAAVCIKKKCSNLKYEPELVPIEEEELWKETGA